MNLLNAEKELLHWHARLGHINFEKVKFLMRSGILSNREAARCLQTAASKLSLMPKCTTCQYGKQCHRSVPETKTSTIRDETDTLKHDHLMPGQCVSVNHFVCLTKGQLFTSRRKSDEKDMYCGGCIFVDHASGLVHIDFQSHLNTHKTATAKDKDKFELMCHDFGVIPQSYISNNGSAFTSKGFMDHLANFEQVICFAGTGTHHTAGIAEHAIQTIMSIACTMMLHSAIHWPDVANPTLWPMAVAHAVFLYNHIPQLKTGLLPHDVFLQTSWPQHKFHDLHVWGWPVYILEKALVDGKKLPRWSTRSQRMVNMGF